MSETEKASANEGATGGMNVRFLSQAIYKCDGGSQRNPRWQLFFSWREKKLWRVVFTRCGLLWWFI